LYTDSVVAASNNQQGRRGGDHELDARLVKVGAGQRRRGRSARHEANRSRMHQ